MNKRDVRKSFTEKRLLLTAAQIGEFSGKMIDLFSSLSLQGIQHLLSYYPLPERREFDPAPCEQLLQLENEELQIYWPKLYDDEGSMEAHPKDENTRLVVNKFGIPEPETSFFVEPQLIDAVFVPLLAFDLKGFRVGYGKGFYDRYLSRCAQDVVKIGFSYFGPMDRISDVNEYDIPLSFCITPERIYEF